jgi:hypothetical protein
MVEDIINLSMSGIFSILILNLTFSFLLGVRLTQMQKNILSLGESLEKEVSLLNERLDALEDASR